MRRLFIIIAMLIVFTGCSGNDTEVNTDTATVNITDNATAIHGF